MRGRQPTYKQVSVKEEERGSHDRSGPSPPVPTSAPAAHTVLSPAEAGEAGQVWSSSCSGTQGLPLYRYKDRLHLLGSYVTGTVTGRGLLRGKWQTGCVVTK